jgi:hypothetical protein
VNWLVGILNIRKRAVWVILITTMNLRLPLNAGNFSCPFILFIISVHCLYYGMTDFVNLNSDIHEEKYLLSGAPRYPIERCFA